MYDIVTDFIVSASTSCFMDFVLTYLVFLHSLGIFIYSLPSWIYYYRTRGVTLQVVALYSALEMWPLGERKDQRMNEWMKESKNEVKERFYHW